MDFSSLRSLTFKERLKVLEKLGNLSKEELRTLQKNICHRIDLAETLVENATGYFPLPLGVVPNFVINGSVYHIPLAIEETSIIAGLSKTMKWIRETGQIHTSVLGHHMIGQIQLAALQDPLKFEQIVKEQSSRWLLLANEGPAKSMFQRGGGAQQIDLRLIKRPDGDVMGVLHVLVDVKDAMGANVVNQICEYLKPHIEQDTGEQVTICILSNLADHKRTKAQIILQNVDPILGGRLQEASLFAQLDPYRAATNNKGIMNGMDGVCIATGNDWRALEAGAHAYAAQTGQYRSLSIWKYQGTTLTGTLDMPITVGIVGGVTKVHPIAQIALKILGVTSADELAQVMVAVGLVQNLAALRALVTEGIVHGHMKLHIQNLVLLTDALPFETEELIHRLETLLNTKNFVTATDAQTILEEMRGRND